MAAPIRSIRSRPPRAVARTLAAGLCLSTVLTLSSCWGSDDPPVVTSASESPAVEVTASPTAPSGSGLGTASGRTATATPTLAWSPPNLKFYNEDYSVWYQDDSVINSDSVTSDGNIEGYRTYSGTCMGYETRDISREVYFLGQDDETMSSSLVEVKDSKISEYSETGRTTVDLVRDDGGTMEGYSITWTGVFTYSDGTTENVEGYHFARTVGEAGLEFSVLAMCASGYNLTPEEWNTILAGIRIEGLSAGKMSS